MSEPPRPARRTPAPAEEQCQLPPPQADENQLPEEAFLCPLCGAAMFGIHCKLKCPNCGYMEDCTDLFRR